MDNPQKRTDDETRQYMEGKDIFWLPDGRIYHLGVKKGEIFPRILTVGDHERADAFATLFDPSHPVMSKTSSRLFRIHSGYYKGVGISIIGIGMGSPMADFLMREASTLLPEQHMYVIRCGTCGIINENVKPGTFLVAEKGSMFCSKNYNYQPKNCMAQVSSDISKPYSISPIFLPDAFLTSLLIQKLAILDVNFHAGLNLTTDSFYSSQGRKLLEFDDNNADLLQLFSNLGVDSLEMETFTILYLSHLRSNCSATALHLGICSRTNLSLRNINEDEIRSAMMKGGKACMETLADVGKNIHS